ncbi:MAG: Hsp20/alpha crystallin family protein [Betaproteobacteria bacterium]
MANISRIDPFNDIVDDLFKGFFVRPVAYGGQAQVQAEAPRIRVDVTESEAAYVVSADLPGVRKEDIQVAIDGNQVTLGAEVKREKEIAEGNRVLHVERAIGKSSRSFTLPQELDEAKAEAKFRDGVLELTLPKKAATARRQIEIN